MKDLRKTHYQNLYLFLKSGKTIKISIPAQITEPERLVRVEVTPPIPLPKEYEWDGHDF